MPGNVESPAGARPELRERANPQRLVDQPRTLRPEARKPQHRHEAFRRLARELTEERQAAGFCQSGDFPCQVGPDAR
jgi:hypothetical protein